MNQAKLEAGVGKFMIYLGDYTQRPEYNIIPFDEFSGPRRKSKPPTPPPDIIQLVYDAAHGANVSITDAWNMPLGEAYISQSMYYKQQGLQVDFMTESEREFQEALKAELEKRNGSKHASPAT
jgi:hypothetical protein